MKQEIKPAYWTSWRVGSWSRWCGCHHNDCRYTSLSQMRMENNEEKNSSRTLCPLTDLNDIVFGGWDIFPDNAYEAAMYAEVLKEKDLNGVKDELEAIKPMPAAFRSQLGKTSEWYTYQEGCYPLGNGRTTASGHPRL